MFCKHCGKELVNDNAYVCINCGCVVGEAPKAVSVKTEKPQEKTSGGLKLAKVFMILTFTFLCLHLMMIICSIGYAAANHEYLLFEADFVAWAFIFALLANMFSTAQFIITLICEKGFTATKMISIMLFIAALLCFWQGAISLEFIAIN